MDNLRDVLGNPHHRFVQGDICDPVIVGSLASDADTIVNFAAETHVDRSILEPGGFIQTDVYGTYVLMEAARRFNHHRYIQISTDEVYGSIEIGAFTEESPLQPNSPYAASKAAGDLLVLSYVHTYHFPAIITRASNNFGPNQYPEKMIPLFITNAIEDQPLPLYGDGLNVRDWIYVLDHCAGIDRVLHHGETGQVYNIGGGNERTNIDLTRLILKELNKPNDLIRSVTDRPGHDRRYALSCQKASALGFKPQHLFEEVLCTTVRWYQENTEWVYGEGRQNFVTNLLEWVKAPSALRLVSDSVGSPTHTLDLANAISGLVDQGTVNRIFHVSGEGSCNWVEYGQEILKIAGIEKEIIPIHFEELNRPAKRPRYSVLSNDALRQEGLTMRHWKIALREFMGNRVKRL